MLYFQDKRVFLWTRLNIQQMTDPCFSKLSQKKEVGEVSEYLPLDFLPMKSIYPIYLELYISTVILGNNKLSFDS